jgi:hypothetical protein
VKGVGSMGYGDGIQGGRNPGETVIRRFCMLAIGIADEKDLMILEYIYTQLSQLSPKNGTLGEWKVGSQPNKEYCRRR